MLLYQFRSGSGDQQHNGLEIQRAAIPSANTRPSTLTTGLLNRENAETVAPASRREGRKLGRRCPYTGAELIVYGT